jgi:hypothetical protein
MSKRVYFDGEPRIEYSACTPPLKLPTFALWNEGRTPTAVGAMAEAVARRNRKRIATRCWEPFGEPTSPERCYRVVFTDRRPALPGSDLFHVPRATMYFRVKVPHEEPGR